MNQNQRTILDRANEVARDAALFSSETWESDREAARIQIGLAAAQLAVLIVLADRVDRVATELANVAVKVEQR